MPRPEWFEDLLHQARREEDEQREAERRKATQEVEQRGGDMGGEFTS